MSDNSTYGLFIDVAPVVNDVDGETLLQVALGYLLQEIIDDLDEVFANGERVNLDTLKVHTAHPDVPSAYGVGYTFETEPWEEPDDEHVCEYCD